MNIDANILNRIFGQIKFNNDKIIVDHNQVEFTPDMPGSFNIQKLINVIPPQHTKGKKK